MRRRRIRGISREIPKPAIPSRVERRRRAPPPRPVVEEPVVEEIDDQPLYTPAQLDVLELTPAMEVLPQDPWLGGGNLEDLLEVGFITISSTAAGMIIGFIIYYSQHRGAS